MLTPEFEKNENSVQQVHIIHLCQRDMSSNTQCGSLVSYLLTNISQALDVYVRELPHF